MVAEVEDCHELSDVVPTDMGLCNVDFMKLMNGQQGTGQALVLCRNKLRRVLDKLEF